VRIILPHGAYSTEVTHKQVQASPSCSLCVLKNKYTMEYPSFKSFSKFWYADNPLAVVLNL